MLQADTVSTYHIGETLLSLQKAVLIPGGSESLVYTTLSGGVGMLVPFTSREVSNNPSSFIFKLDLSLSVAKTLITKVRAGIPNINILLILRY